MFNYFRSLFAIKKSLKWDRYKTPKYPLEYAMQLQVIHKQQQPVKTGEAVTQKC